jgi:hypothetical protein
MTRFMHKYTAGCPRFIRRAWVSGVQLFYCCNTPLPVPYTCQEFEKHELVLQAKVSFKNGEHDELVAKMDELGQQLEAKQIEASSISTARDAVVDEFKALVADKHPFIEVLAHAFHRWAGNDRNRQCKRAALVKNIYRPTKAWMKP